MNDFQWIAHGALGGLGAHVQSPVAKELRLAQDPRLGHFMVEAHARETQPHQSIAIQIHALVSSISMNILFHDLVSVFERYIFS